MAKLLFDPVTYQFYYRCRSEETAPAIAAGFGWDSIRRRYCTDDPSVAMSLAKYGDTYRGPATPMCRPILSPSLPTSRAM
jgi:hypothetical protein